MSRLTALECPSVRMSRAHVWRALPFGRDEGKEGRWCPLTRQLRNELGVGVMYVLGIKLWHCISSSIVHPPLPIFQVTARGGYAVAGIN